MKAQVIESGKLLFSPNKYTFLKVPEGKFAVGMLANSSATAVNGVDMVGKYYDDKARAELVAGAINIYIPEGK